MGTNKMKYLLFICFWRDFVDTLSKSVIAGIKTNRQSNDHLIKPANLKSRKELVLLIRRQSTHTRQTDTIQAAPAGWVSKLNVSFAMRVVSL